MPQVDVETTKHPQRWKSTVVGVLALLAMVVIVGALVLFSGPSPQEVVKHADELNDHGHYSEALNNLQEAYNKPFLSKDDKALIVSRLAATKADMGDQNAAMKYLQELNELQPNRFEYQEMLGDKAYFVGNKPVALSAYRQAVALMKAGKQGPLTQGEIDRMSRRMEELQQ